MLPNTSVASPMDPTAIIGMASLFPEVYDLQQFWDNIVHARDCISDVPVLATSTIRPEEAPTLSYTQ